MFKKHSYDELKGFLEKWLETGKVEEQKDAEVKPTTTSDSTTTAKGDVKDAFDSLFNEDASNSKTTVDELPF